MRIDWTTIRIAPNRRFTRMDTLFIGYRDYLRPSDPLEDGLHRRLGHLADFASPIRARQIRWINKLPYNFSIQFHAGGAVSVPWRAADRAGRWELAKAGLGD